MRLQKQLKAAKTDDESKNVLARMYVALKDCASQYICAFARRNARAALLSAEEKDEKAHSAACYIVSRYLRSADFEITASFTAYVYLRVLRELFYRRKIDAIIDFDSDKADKAARADDYEINDFY